MAKIEEFLTEQEEEEVVEAIRKAEKKNFRRDTRTHREIQQRRYLETCHGSFPPFKNGQHQRR